jgi:hypothetical protein
LPSVSVDDRWIFELAPVDVGLKNQWTRPASFDAVVQLTVNNELDLFATVGTGGFDLHDEGALAQMPLHEGRRYRVFRSGGVESLACAEDQMVSGLLCRHWKSPGHLLPLWASEKEQILLEIFNDARRTFSGQMQRV